MCCSRRSALRILLFLIPILTDVKQTATRDTNDTNRATNVRQYMSEGFVIRDVSVPPNSYNDGSCINGASTGDEPILVRDTSTHRPPHLIMILADDLGWHDVSWTGTSARTPNLERLARTGLILDQSYAQPSCSPSRAALLTGRYPHTIGRQTGPIRPFEPTGLPLSVPTIAYKLRNLGYSTHVFGKWHLGFCDGRFTPTNRGFDSFHGFLLGAQNHFTHRRRTKVQGTYIRGDGYDYWKNTSVDWTARGKYSSVLMLDHVRQLLTTHDPQSPLFLYLPLQLVHGPLQVPSTYTKPFEWVQHKDRRQLLGMVSAMDDLVGNIVTLLKENGYYNNSVIGFTSDNGGARTESGYSWPLRGTKGTTWEGGTRVPTLLHSPLINAPGRTFKGLFHITDWYPTFLGLAGGTAPPGIDGVDQWGALQGTAEPPREQMIYDLKTTAVLKGAIRLKNYKLILGPLGTYNWYIPPELDTDSLNLTLPAVNWDPPDNASSYSSEERRRQSVSSSEPSGLLQDSNLVHVAGYDRNLTVNELLHEMTAEMILNSGSEIYLFDLEADPTERHDLRRSQPRVALQLLQALLAELSREIPEDKQHEDPRGLPVDGVWAPGWCTAKRLKTRRGSKTWPLDED